MGCIRQVNMRLWKLEELAEKYPGKLVIHICEDCGYRTPLPVKIALNNVLDDPSDDLLEEIEYVRHNVCDKCNTRAWQEVREHTEYTQNNCKYCGGGRCRHYPEN